MTTLHRTIGTTTENLTTNCIRRGCQGPGAKIVLVASDNVNVQNWLYQYLEPYEQKGYGFVFVETEYDFIDYARKHDTVMAFIEDMFFGERILGKLENIKSDYPRLRLTVFTTVYLPDDVVARYVCWSDGSFLSLRSGKDEINKSVKSIFDYQQTYPSYLINAIYEYKELPDKEPYLTPKEYEVVRLFSEGFKGEKIAAMTGISERTLWTHTQNIYRKFGMHKMTKVIKFAIAKGLLPAKIKH
jgi:DNA-binding NarL/FixJ family response regulator